jgi:hypothetical protein
MTATTRTRYPYTAAELDRTARELLTLLARALWILRQREAGS